ncbi:hypothetical protein SA21235_0336 [Staphylococcus aureus subsp. aureus 21235]|nr:hypothetical protein SA21235_0336 [Staphylococcus aureus subsp. aureus 21235]
MPYLRLRFTIIFSLKCKIHLFFNSINAILYCSVFKSNEKKRVNKKLRLLLTLCIMSFLLFGTHIYIAYKTLERLDITVLYFLYLLFKLNSSLSNLKQYTKRFIIIACTIRTKTCLETPFITLKYPIYFLYCSDFECFRRFSA